MFERERKRGKEEIETRKRVEREKREREENHKITKLPLIKTVVKNIPKLF